MDWVPVLSTTIVVATIATVVLAVGTYIAYKQRERRRPQVHSTESVSGEPLFFRRYHPGEDR